MVNELTLGYSPCPNDTFIFYGLAHRTIDLGTLAFAPPLLADVEQLNLWAMAKKLDVTKLSFHALGHVLDEYCLLSAGSALGRGCGPLLVATGKLTYEQLAGSRVAIPGRYTTAALLLKMFLPGCGELVEMRFDQIMSAVGAGEVDAGVIIHESRFTYQDHGLVCLQDLGQWWEETTGMPIPLGGIAARRSLGKELIDAVDRTIKSSLQFAHAHPQACLPYIRAHSQELDPVTVQAHIGLYVNDFSLDLGAEGWAAVASFLSRGHQAGALPAPRQLHA
jgi:1,4-dihydroxy-6-naphthoate synthase